MISIGTPNNVFYKSEELEKFGSSESLTNLSEYNDFFYNYNTLGLVEKITRFILYSNF